jgi:hypothetical protein
VETTFFTAVFNVVELFLLIREKMLTVLAVTFLLITIIFGLPFVIIQNFKRYESAVIEIMETPPILSPQPPPLPSVKKPFAFQAAQASLLAPAIAFGIGIVVNVGLSGQSSPLVSVITGSVGILLIVSGFILGIIALAGVPRYGKKGILGRSIAGICINGILIALMIISIPMYKKIAEHAKEIHQQQMEQQQPHQ